MTDFPLPVIGFVAWSGTGKTTLLRQLIPELAARGRRVSVIKHAHHHFDLDFPGKDSYELRKAGAAQTVICTTTRMATISEFDTPDEEPALADIVGSLDLERVDLVLVEGYKDIRFPKIELYRESVGKPPLYPNDDAIIALATDSQPPAGLALPHLDINRIDRIADFVVDWMTAAQPA